MGTNSISSKNSNVSALLFIELYRDLIYGGNEEVRASRKEREVCFEQMNQEQGSAGGDVISKGLCWLI